VPPGVAQGYGGMHRARPARLITHAKFMRHDCAQGETNRALAHQTLIQQENVAA
jgi:hypothetical protein